MAKREVYNVEQRGEVGQKAVRRLRTAGKVPAILYGDRKDVIALTLPEVDVTKMYRSGARMVDLSRGGRAEPALIKEVQFDPLGDMILHVDFQRVPLDKKIQLKVPLQFTGTPKGLGEGGVLQHVMADLMVECLPTEIPDHITVNVAPLKLGEALHLKDLQFPEGVRPVGDPESIVAAVTFQAAEPEAAPAPETEMKEPEVITEKRREEEPPEEEKKKK
jgi:large subunit ribosomal protein L25